MSAAEAPAPLIEARKIAVYSGDYKVLKEISLTIPEGRVTVILGPTGCGKSTLLKVLAGVLIPHSGELFVRGRNFHALREKELLEFRKQNGFVFQDSALWQNKTIFENLSLPLRFHFPSLTSAEITSRVRAALEEIGLLDSIQLRPAQLSTGEQRIVSFRRALMTEPTLLFLDEPTVSIDLAMRRKLLVRLLKAKATAMTIVAVTHDAEILSALAEHLVLLRDGFVVRAGPAEEITASDDESVREILAESTMERPRRPVGPVTPEEDAAPPPQ